MFFLDHNKKDVLRMIDLAKLLAVVCGATLLGVLFVKSGFPETNIVVIYIFAVLLVARFTKGYFYGILSSVVCLLCFNYFFTAPYHTLAVNDPSYMITFCVMLITALITSALTTKEKLMTMKATIFWIMQLPNRQLNLYQKQLQTSSIQIRKKIWKNLWMLS